jgi:hypothetical protein
MRSKSVSLSVRVWETTPKKSRDGFAGSGLALVALVTPRPRSAASTPAATMGSLIDAV